MNEAQLSSLMEEFARTRDPVLRDLLVEHHLPMSRAVARKFAGQGVDVEDLEQVAAMALVKAVDRFDFSRNLKFSTFAMPTMAGEVRNYIRDKGSAIRMSRDARSQLYRMRQLREQLTQDLRRALIGLLNNILAQSLRVQQRRFQVVFILAVLSVDFCSIDSVDVELHILEHYINNFHICSHNIPKRK